MSLPRDSWTRSLAALLLLTVLVLTSCGKDPEKILEEADAAREVGLHQAALDRYLELREEDPKRYAHLDERIGDTYSSLGAPEQALTFWALALQREPENAALWFKRGAFLVASGKTGEGQAALERAIGLDPENAQAHLNLGVLHFQAKRLQPALLHLGRAAELSPDNAEIHKALGAARIQVGDRAGAGRALFAAWKMDRKVMEAAQLFQLLGSNGQWVEAAEVGEVAVESSGDPMLLIQYGATLIQAGQGGRGRRILKTLSDLDLPGDLRSEIQRLLAMPDPSPGGSPAPSAPNPALEVPPPGSLPPGTPPPPRAPGALPGKSSVAAPEVPPEAPGPGAP